MFMTSRTNARWLKYLPGFVQARLEGRHTLQAVLGNSGWLVADKVLRMGVGLVVGVWIARYLGPQQFGLWNYATAFAGLFGAFATLGLDNIVVRELVRHPERRNEVLGSAFVLKLAGGAITLGITLLAISLARSDDLLALWLVGLASAGYIFQSLNVINFHFQAKVQARYTVYAANGAFLLTTLAKIWMLLTAAPLIAFAWAGFAEVVLTSAFLIVAYLGDHQHIRQWRFKASEARSLLRDSWPLMLSALAVMLYMRVDQVMIGHMLGDREVGVFSAAVKISEIWYFIPIAIISSAFPAILDCKKRSEALYRKRLQDLFSTMAWMGVAMAALMTFASGTVVHLLYGPAYAGAAPVLTIHIWAGIFVALGAASASGLTAENMQKYGLYRTINGCIANVALNFLLIPRYGISGAAIATVLSYGFSVLSIGFFRPGRFMFWMMLRSFNPFAQKRAP